MSRDLGVHLGWKGGNLRGRGGNWGWFCLYQAPQTLENRTLRRSWGCVDQSMLSIPQGSHLSPLLLVMRSAPLFWRWWRKYQHSKMYVADLVFCFALSCEGLTWWCISHWSGKLWNDSDRLCPSVYLAIARHGDILDDCGMSVVWTSSVLVVYGIHHGTQPPSVINYMF